MDSVLHLQGNTLFQGLVQIVTECQQHLEGKKEIATESNSSVEKLCAAWENVLCFGIKSNKNKILETIDIIGKVSDFPLWDFCQSHLTKDERGRFDNLKNVSTKRGKLNALIRCSLNERSLQRYLSMWLGDIRMQELYEPWAVVLNAEAGQCLPKLAEKLSNILFAIQVDNMEIDYEKPTKKEPLIYVPAPVGPKKRTNAIKRRILTYCADTSSSKAQNDKEVSDHDVQAYVVETCIEELNDIQSSMAKLSDLENTATNDESRLSRSRHFNVVTAYKLEEQTCFTDQHDFVVKNLVDVSL